ncbi:hypothetical protein [Nocardia brasiliensis]|nr:hypothetical protein [Nocardia brasiliensis]
MARSSYGMAVFAGLTSLAATQHTPGSPIIVEFSHRWVAHR